MSFDVLFATTFSTQLLREKRTVLSHEGQTKLKYVIPRAPSVPKVMAVDGSALLIKQQAEDQD